MRRWISTRSSSFAGLRGQKPRCFSSIINDVERVSVQNGSSGFFTIDLHNIAKVSSTDPLLIYLPPYSTAFTDRPAQLPKFIQKQPTAVINYRWAGFTPFQTNDLHVSEPHEQSEEGELTHLSWPTPIHDTARAYDWIVENLNPSTCTRRDIYVYGSYLGASLATSLALTETHIHELMGIRGCIAFNGIYNWTTFLPDHRINNIPKLSCTVEPNFRELRQNVEALFVRADNLFDPFASSCLFFYTPGLRVPPSFNASALGPSTALLANLYMSPKDIPDKLLVPLKPPRKSPLIFPPMDSTLKLPEMLLLHSMPPPPSLPPSLLRRRHRRKKEHLGNHFRAQAEELAVLMRKSMVKGELEKHFEWDNDLDVDAWNYEAAGRVQKYDTGLNTGDFDLSGKGEELAAAWLRDHIN